MTPIHWVSAALVAGLGVATLYNGNQTAALQSNLAATERVLAQTREQVEALKAKEQEHADILAKQSETLATQEETLAIQAKTLERLGSTEDIARTVVEGNFLDLIEALSTSLTSDPTKVEALTGPMGPSPEIEVVIAYLLDQGLAESIGYRIWEDRYQELAAMPKVISQVADVVYKTYGKELKGADGDYASPEDIAKALALDPQFISLLELQIEDN